MYEVLFGLTLIFAIAAVLLLLATQLSLPIIPFYLVAGILVGVAIDEAQLIDLAQWGIAFLVFLFGVHVDLDSIRATARTAAGVGVLQATAVGVAGGTVGLAVGLGALDAIYFGVAAALSSSLVARSYLDRPAGKPRVFERLSEAIHFTEDVLGVLVVLALSAFVYRPGSPGQQFLVAAGLVALALCLRYLLFHRATARIQGDSEVMMLLGVSHVVGFIALAEFVGLSIIVGAFAAGIAIADDFPHSLELVDTVDDLEDFFSPIFFVTLGALLSIPDPVTVGLATALVLLVLVVNPLVMTVILLARGYESRTAVLTGLRLDQVSVFSLFVALEALAGGTIGRQVFDAIILAAVVTMIAAAYTSRYDERLHRGLHETGIPRLFERFGPDRAQVPDDLSDHVIVVGIEHGETDEIASALRTDRPVLAVEDDPTRLATVNEQYDAYVYGDALDDRVWQQARLEDAALVLSLTPELDRAAAVVSLDTAIPRLVRVDEPAAARTVLDRGASAVIYPDAVAGDRLATDVEALLAGEISPDAFSDRGW